MAAAQFTVTAYSGPGQLNTAQVFTGVTSYTVDVAKGTLQLNFSGETFRTFDLDGVTTFTVSISGGNQTCVVS